MDAGIACPECGANMSSVLKTEPRVGFIYRRRICPKCQTRVSTTERIAGSGGQANTSTCDRIVASRIHNLIEILGLSEFFESSDDESAL